jgi:amidase
VITRRAFVSGAVGAAAVAAAAGRAGAASEIEEATIEGLGAAMGRGATTAARLVELYLARIAALDARTVRSVLVTNPDAPRDAELLDRERAGGRVRGPLHGIPILVKANLDTADRMPTSAGSLALAGHRARKDAAVVARLRAAGAVLLGKTNLSEWANIRSTHSSSGWSAEGGQTRNAYVLDRSPSGSSSGSASAAAASFCAAAVGTETDGSILSPASCQGLVGLKPTVGLLGGAGIIPIAHSQDTAGPMARTVADAALLLAGLGGPDDAAASLRAATLRGARLGVLARDELSRSPAAERVFAEAARAMRDAGAVLVEDVRVPDTYREVELDVLLHELKHDLGVYLAASGARVRSLADVIAFNEANAAAEMPFFGQELFVMAQRKGPLTDPAYRELLPKHRSARRGLEAALARHRLDALIAPTGGPAWTIDLVNGDACGYSSTSLAAVAGTPSITVPAGDERGLPIGVSFMGPARGEARLLALARAFEQVTRARRPPAFRATVGA